MGVSLGTTLLRWLRDMSVGSSELPEHDYLPELPPVEWLTSGVGGLDRTVSPAEFAAGLLAVARDGEPGMRAAALGVLASAEARWWLAVDGALREQWWSVPRWSRSLAAELADGEVELLNLVIAGCHRDGRIREVAVAHLADHPHPAALAVLALRTVDWVAEVRQRARGAIQSWLSSSQGSLTQFAEMAFALCGRGEGGWLVERVEGVLRDLPLDGLEPLLIARDRRTRRAAYRAATTRGLLSVRRLTAAAMKDDDLPIRALCARAAVESATSPAQLRGLLVSRTALVRAEALQAVTAVGDLRAAEAALPDRHPLVRAIAQGAFRRSGADPADSYRLLAGWEPPAPGAIAGLGETGDAEDAGLVRRWLAHPRSRGRVEAVRALRRLGVTGLAELVPLLRDESGAVTRQVVVALRHDLGILDPGMLQALLGLGNAPHVRFAGYRLLRAGNAWQRLTINLRLLDDPDDRLRGSARADLTAWLDRQAATTYHGPSRERATELDKLIEHARPILGEHKVRLLRFHAGLPQQAAL
ncbi:hypothetical protein [Micromonospora sp. HM134]|uniref:HEAT repeat domain-containing protein n=1 Tax=Micromonospora sp. HM134 TaxID=2583243 RepID=UPI001F0D218C|nr:hypothetical protein [Micromonospora sp. HM134]